MQVAHSWPLNVVPYLIQKKKKKLFHIKNKNNLMASRPSELGPRAIEGPMKKTQGKWSRKIKDPKCTWKKLEFYLKKEKSSYPTTVVNYHQFLFFVTLNFIWPLIFLQDIYKFMCTAGDVLKLHFILFYIKNYLFYFI